jgi:undecaprenyl diphosphate synthase
MENELGQKYHVGIILDGNGRWATSQNQPRLFGHTSGFKNIALIAKACPEHNIKVITVYAFAIANWKRDKEEVDGLWNLFREFFDSEIYELHKNDVKVVVIGRRDEIADDVVARIEKAEQTTSNNKGVILQVALNYDGVEEVVRATKKIVALVKSGSLAIEDITQATISDYLDTREVADPDVIIRTGMPQPESETGLAMWRSSTFLQLQSAQSVCVATPILWPDFSASDLKEVMSFAKPDDRLFGGQRK